MVSVGCARSFQALSADGGRATSDAEPPPRSDAAPRPDAGPFCQDPLTSEEAACLGLDAPACATCHTRGGVFCLRPLGVPPSPPDITPTRPVEECLPRLCDEVLALEDSAPIVLEAAGAAYPATLGRDGAQAWLAHLRTNPAFCDSSCLGVVPVPGHGEFSDDFAPAYWLEGFSGPDVMLSARSRASGGALLIGRSAARVAWQPRPLRGEGWMPEGVVSVALDTEIADVAPDGDEDVLIATLAPDFDGDGYHGGLQVQRYSFFGALLGSESVPNLLTDFEVRDVRLVSAPSGGTAWIAAIQNWDFPPTVQLGRVDGSAVSLRGSSCGVESFDVELMGSQAVVAQNCPTEVELRGGAAGTSEGSLTISSTRSVPAALVVSRDLIVVAHAAIGARSPTVTVLRIVEPGLLTIEQVTRLPAGSLIDPVGALDVTALEDGAVVVAWNTLSPDPSPESGQVALVRLRPCSR